MDCVLLHGTTQSPAGWDRLADALRRRGHGVETVDLPTGRPGLLAAGYARLAVEQTTARSPVVIAHSAAGCSCPRSPPRSTLSTSCGRPRRSRARSASGRTSRPTSTTS
ncbi:esterase/lipase family protein [Amycolatopsis acidiphila]|uniref:esterase/lipase family protein n=1 Tax=Amycolatopsis acidiphila TaxID=715473 RepID=UPI002D793CBA|nr:alpha/beta fold hydrolase [Amycolatopsis acidiphila]